MSHGDPIKLVAQFNVPTAAERDSKIDAIRAEMDLLSGGNLSESDSEPEIEVNVEQDDFEV